MRSLRPIDRSTLRPASWPNSLLAVTLVGVLLLSWAANFPARLTPQQAVGGVVVLIPFLLVPWRPRIPEHLLAVAIASEIVAAFLGISAGSDVVSIVAVYTIAAE
jgi:hypothetical protein